MSTLAILQTLTLQDIAAALELHPHEVIRVLVANDLLTDDLRFERDAVETVRELGGVQTWWTEAPPDDEAALPESLLSKFTTHGATSEDSAARFDNLLRGLSDDQQRGVRQATRQLIQTGALKMVSSATGMRIYKLA